jgi:DNA-binding PadR family transcriptional regulator
MDISVAVIDKDTGMPDVAIPPDDLLPLTPAVFHILLALADGEKHGYSIMQEVARITDGKIQMGPGTLYGTIKRMLEARLIEEIDERPDPTMDDERRRYYRLTPFGERVTQAEISRLTMLLNVAQSKRLMGGANS